MEKVCANCGDAFTETELTELRNMGEKCFDDGKCFLCPDCYDAFNREDPEVSAEKMING